MDSFKPYLLMVVLIFPLIEANDCIHEMNVVFKDNMDFISCYNYAYHQKTMEEVKKKSEELGPRPFSYYYMEYIFQHVNYEGILIGSEYCEEEAVQRGISNATRGLQQLTGRAPSNIVLDVNDCIKELEANNFHPYSKYKIFEHAFKMINEESIPKGNTYAIGYFEHIYSKTELINFPANVTQWCDESLGGIHWRPLFTNNETKSYHEAEIEEEEENEWNYDSNID